MFDNGDDRDIGGGFNPAGLRRNMETGEMYVPGTVSNQGVSSPVKRSAVTPAQTAPKAPPVKEDYPSQDKSFNGPRVTDAYPDESRRGRMASAQEGAAPRVASAPASAASRAASAAARPASAARSSASAVDQIPKDSSLYRNVTGGAPVTGSELSRNVGNTLSALTPLGGGFGKVGAELMTAKSAAERAAKARELAEAARRAKPATTLKSSASTAPARANQAAKSGRKKFNEDEEGVIFKRGGSTKKMASGGMTVSKASSRADCIAQRGKTRGKIC
jgi:hypothetical protein